MEPKTITLTPDQKEETMASKKEIEQGLFVDHEVLDKEPSEWLSKE